MNGILKGPNTCLYQQDKLQVSKYCFFPNESLNEKYSCVTGEISLWAQLTLLVRSWLYLFLQTAGQPNSPGFGAPVEVFLLLSGRRRMYQKLRAHMSPTSELPLGNLGQLIFSGGPICIQCVHVCSILRAQLSCTWPALLVLYRERGAQGIEG